jgi:hypothetical protein
VLVAGGLDASGALASCELVGGSGSLPSLQVGRAYATATELASGCVLVAGGFDGRSVLASLELYSGSGGVARGATTNLGPTALASVGSSGASSSVNVTALSPSWGAVGTSVTITGTGFDVNAVNDLVTFNGAAATVASVDVSNPQAEKLTVVVPAGATTGPVVVTVGGQASPQAPLFTLGAPGSGVPVILVAAPTTASVFFPVSITGQNFGPSPSITFNGVPTASIVSLSTKTLPLIGQVSEIVVLVPPGATSGPLVVSNGGQASAPVSFTVQ